MAQNLIEEIDQQIAANKDMVYSKSTCPHCNTTKQTLQAKNIAFQVVELNQVGNGSDIQNALAQKTGQRTVPNIFINGEHIGGNSELQTIANNGQLDAKVAA